MDYDQLEITSGKYWSVFLHKDQTVPGRIYFWYKENKEDLLDIRKEAITEFFKLGRKVRSALKKSFNPDMFNYLSLSNHTKHLHIHLIPRYSKKIKAFGLTFKDSTFGKSYKRNKEFNVSGEILIKLKNKIKGTL